MKDFEQVLEKLWACLTCLRKKNYLIKKKRNMFSRQSEILEKK